MAKVIKITGEKSPITGTHYLYTATLESNATEEDKKKVRWQLYLKDETGNWIKHPKSPERKENKAGAIQDYAFGELFTNQELLLTAFNEKAVFSEPPALKITPIAGDPKITKFFFTDLTGKTLEEIFYNQRMMLQIHTVGMLGKKVNYSIYYDANGTKTEVRKGQSKEIIKPNGVVNPEESFMIDMPIRTGQSTSADEHHFKIKIWQTDNEAIFYEEELKVKNEMGKMDVPQDSQVPVKTGTSEPVKPKKDEKKNPCSDDFTLSQIKKVWPSATNTVWMQGIVDELNKSYPVKGETKKLYDIFDLNTCLKRAHFFAQAFVESNTDLSGAFNGESLNYSVEALRSGYPFSVFKKNKKYYDYADKIGRKAEIDPKTKKKKIIQVANQEEIANIAYDDDNRGKDYKLGNVNKGDGWKFRGRGLMQITGRSNYKSIQEIIDYRLPNSGIDLSVGKATFTAKEAVFAGLGDWILKKANILAENGATPEVVNSITAKVNYSTSSESYKNRRDAFLRTKEIFKEEKK